MRGGEGRKRGRGRLRFTGISHTGFAKSSKLTALKTPVVLVPLSPSPGSGRGAGFLLLLPGGGTDIDVGTYVGKVSLHIKTLRSG